MNIFRTVADGFVNTVLRSDPFSSFLRRGYAILDRSAKKTISLRLRAMQLQCGAFPGRAGAPDIYYTLWGLVVSRALGVGINRSALRNYAAALCESALMSRCDALALALVAKMSGLRDRRIMKLLSGDIICRRESDVFLEMTARLYILGLREAGKFAREQTPGGFDAASALTASIAARIMLLVIGGDRFFPVLSQCFRSTSARTRLTKVPHKVAQIAELEVVLCARSGVDGGFRAHGQLMRSDLLSTSVALYALRQSRCDMRVLRPAAFEFIGAHYHDGLFGTAAGAGDGDLEYLFYGLLALGALS